MSILPDWKLKERGNQLIEPYSADAVNAASIDVHLGPMFYRARPNMMGYLIDPSESSQNCFDPLATIPAGQYFPVSPQDFVLGATIEKLTIPADMVARFEGKSSLGRIGLLTHITAGFIDPGFSGQITLELKNVHNFPIALYPGMKIGQICFEQLDSPAEIPYGSEGDGSHYQNQEGPTLSQGFTGFSLVDLPS